MAAGYDKKSDTVDDSHVPPPMDPYARYQTPYERQRDQPNPFIEFRRFADQQFASIFDAFAPTKPSNPESKKQAFGESASDLHNEMERIRKRMEERSTAAMSGLSKAFEAPTEQELEDTRKLLHGMSGAMNRVFQDMVDSTDRYLGQRSSDGETNDLHKQYAKALDTSDIDRSSQLATKIKRTIESRTAPQSLPNGWVEAVTADGKKFYINTESGMSSTTIPSTRLATGTTPHTPIDSAPHPLSSEEMRAKWRRGFQNCPELKEHSEETELDVYEQMEQLEAAKERARTWRRGFKNCPELKQMQKSTENQDNQCPAIQRAGIWGFLPVYGFDGMSRARNIPLVISSSGDVMAVKADSPSETLKKPTTPKPKQKDAQAHIPPQTVLDAVRVRQQQMLEGMTSNKDELQLSKKLDQSSDKAIQSSTSQDSQRPVAFSSRTETKTLPDGSTETKRFSTRRFADGREVSQESTTISPAARSPIQQTDKSGNGWFWI